MAVQSTSVVPKYYQVEQLLRRRISTLPEGALLPAEPLLSKEYGVSRTTLRMAVGALVADGLLQRAQGKGTFVATQRLEFPLGYHARTTTPAADELVTHRVLRAERSSAGDEFAAVFGIKPADKVIRIERITYQNDLSMGTGMLVVPVKVAPGLRTSDFATGRFFYTLADYGVKIIHHRVVVESTTMDPAIARLLEIRPGLPSISLVRYGFGKNDSVLAYVRILTRGDIGRYVLDF
jgi:GntR family transcriptional regulator